MSITFPSCQEFADGLTIKTITTSDELINYVNTYSDVWSIKDDILVVERTEFSYSHSWFYNQNLTSGDDGIHYYIIENPGFNIEYSYTLDEDKVFFDDFSKILYISVKEKFNYEEYLKMTSSNTAIRKIKEEAKSNRMFVAINYPEEKIKEVVFIVP